MLGTRLIVIELDQHVAGLDQRAFFHAQVFDNAAIKVLNAFAIALNPYDAISNYGPMQRRRECPSPERTEEQGNDDPSRQGR